MSNKKYWHCLIGPVEEERLPAGADFPLRRAVIERLSEISDFSYENGVCASGWGVDEERYQILRKIGIKSTLELNNLINKVKPKILIIGHARHGKDSMAEILNYVFGLNFKSSSQAAANIFLYDALKEKYGYKTPKECFIDRVNHRAEWYDLICEYNKDDRARLAKDILKDSDCYVGMRDRDEILECLRQKVFDLVIWVDASKRLPLESSESFNIDESCADIIIDNNTTYEDFKDRVIRLGKVIFK